ncbi:MAG: NAD(P)H-hydrate dehydratase [Opitutaceae bacterium]
MKFLPHAHPVLTCQHAGELESSILENADAEWGAMKLAGNGVADALLLDYQELFDVPDQLRVVALVGKGHNGGDALIASARLLALYPRAKVSLLLSADASSMKPLAKRAYDQLEGRVEKHMLADVSDVEQVTSILDEVAGENGIDVCLDGILGASFKPPLRTAERVIIEAVNAFDAIGLRAAVDLPSGRGDESDELTFEAQFTYATGIAKHALFEGVASCGRVRYIDLGFFKTASGSAVESKEHILQPSVLAPLQKLRPASVDKRSFGHLFIVGGSAYMPGALLMAVQAAVRSGVGLVTAFAPASVASVLSAQVPEAIWIPWPETSHGTLNPRALPLLLERLDYASAVLCGPGMGRDRSTEMIAQEMVKAVHLPVIMDADALRRKVVEIAPKRKSEYGPVVVTPHMGEFMRIANLSEVDYSIDTLQRFCQQYKLMTVLKGANTRICDGQSVLYNTHGGPVLSRGGSGDLLAGLIGGMVAQDNSDIQAAVGRGVMLHGLAAQELARDKGQVVVSTTELLNYLPKVLRGKLG